MVWDENRRMNLVVGKESKRHDDIAAMLLALRMIDFAQAGVIEGLEGLLERSECYTVQQTDDQIYD